MYFDTQTTLFAKHETAQFFATVLSYALASHKLILDSIPDNTFINNALVLKEALDDCIDEMAKKFPHCDKDLVKAHLADNNLYCYLQTEEAQKRAQYHRDLTGNYEQLYYGWKDLSYFDFPPEEVELFFKNPELILSQASEHLLGRLNDDYSYFNTDFYVDEFRHPGLDDSYALMAWYLDCIFSQLSFAIFKEFLKGRYLVYRHLCRPLSLIAVVGVASAFEEETTRVFESYSANKEKRKTECLQYHSFAYTSLRAL